ncbi:MAG TPA: long-chain fatty acid--CoA ligase [Myxococcales bacterium]|nr:long-chain fatty acid--CoA ligase [Myxococcales bacterium]
MPETVLSLFAEQVARAPRRTALRYRSGGIWRGHTWADWQSTSAAVAAALADCGVQPGDRVAILAHTSVRWVMADLGVLMCGAVTVPIYPTLRADAIGEILRDSGATVIFAEDPVQLAKAVDEEAGELPELQRAVVFERVARLDRPDEAGRLDVTIEDADSRGRPVLSWEMLLERGVLTREAAPELLAQRSATVTPESLAAIYYTSGTSGEPKGVQITHDAFVFETAQICRVMPVSASDEQLLFLPLAHIVAKLTVMLQLRVGFVTSFASSIEDAAEECGEVRPTFIAGVPRVFEKIQEHIEASPKIQGDIQQRVFDWALGVGRRVSALRQEGREPGSLLAVQHRSAHRLVFNRVKQRLGGRLRFMLSGAAPLAKSTAELFHAFDLLILEGYGLTETTGASTLNTVDAYRFGTVGRPLPGVEVKLAEDGEILIRGRSVTAGYWCSADPAAFTDDGYFRTGDVGVFDTDGYLTVTDRKKDIIVTAGGKNVAPARVELRLTRSPYIDRAVVVGDRRKYLVALLEVDREAIFRWADQHGLGGDRSVLLRHPRVWALLSTEVERANEKLASFEQIKRFELLPGELTQASGALTPTGKVKRRFVEEKYADLVDVLYEGNTAELEDLS